MPHARMTIAVALATALAGASSADTFQVETVLAGNPAAISAITYAAMIEEMDQTVGAIIDVLAETEHRRPCGKSRRVALGQVVDRHVVEDQGAALERMGEHVHRRVRPGAQLAIDPDRAIDRTTCRSIRTQRLFSR